MPVILQQKDWYNWLDPSLSKEQMQNILTPCEDKNMNAYTISKLITTRGAITNVPDVKELFPYPELSTEQGTLL